MKNMGGKTLQGSSPKTRRAFSSRDRGFNHLMTSAKKKGKLPKAHD